MDKRSVSLKKILLVDGIRFIYILIIFAALGAFLGYRTTVKYNQNVDKEIKEAAEKKEKEAEEEALAAQDVTETTVYTRAECEKRLKGAALQDVLDTYNWYLERNSRRAYLESSPYLAMDPYDFNSIYLSFRVTHGDLGRDDSAYKSYIHALKIYVTYNNLVDELVEKKGLETTARALSEMISLSDGGKDSYDDFLLMTIYQSDVTKDLTEDVKSLFLGYAAKLTETYPDIALVYEGMSQANYYNGSLNSNIETHRSTLINDQSKIDAAIKKFSGIQKAYYNMLVNGTDEESITEVVTPGTTPKKKTVVEEEEPTKRRILPMVILGGVAGILVGFILFFFANLLSGRLLFTNDFSGVYGIRLLGSFIEKKKNGISGTLQRMEYSEAEDKDDPAYLYLALREAVKKENLSEAVFVGTGKLNDLEGLSGLRKKLEKDGIKISLAEEFPKDIKAADDLLCAKGVILVEEMHRSKLKKIDRVVSFCKDNSIPVIGAVGII